MTVCGRWSIGKYANNFDHTNKWYMHRSQCILGSQNSLEIWDTIWSPGKKTSSSFRNTKKRTSHQVDFAIPDNSQSNSKRKRKSLDLAWEQKKLQNMKVTMIPIIVGALGTFPENKEKRLEELEIQGRTEIIQTTTLLISGRILGRVLKS